MKQQTFSAVVNPAIEWLNENSHPHSYILIRTTGAELLVSEMCEYTEKYLRD